MGSDVDTAATRRGTGNIPTWTKVRRGNRTGRLPTVTTPKEGRDPEYVEKKFQVQRRYYRSPPSRFDPLTGFSRNSARITPDFCMCTLDRHIYPFILFFLTENNAEKEWRNWPLSHLPMIAVPEFKFKHMSMLNIGASKIQRVGA